MILGVQHLTGINLPVLEDYTFPEKGQLSMASVN